MTTSRSPGLHESSSVSAPSRLRHWNNQVRRHSVMISDQPAVRYHGHTLTWKDLHDRSTATLSLAPPSTALPAQRPSRVKLVTTPAIAAFKALWLGTCTAVT